MSDSILEKLDEELNRIRLEQKRENNSLLTEEEIHTVFEVLKKEDFELKPVLESMEKVLNKVYNDQYMLVETTLINLLKYYNLIDNKDIMAIRHKLFFTEERKMIKKPYFSPESASKVKEKIKNVFTKI